MNNCPKCGNPLQPGQTICPICGTNITIAPIAQAPAAPQAPVAPAQPVQPIQPVQPEVQAAPVAPTVTPATQPQVVTPVAPVVEPVAPVAPQAPVAPVQPVQQQVEVTPVVAPVVEEQPAVEKAVEQPIVAPIEPVTPEVTIQPVVETAPVVETTPESQVQEQSVETAPAVIPASDITNVVDAMSLPNLEQLEATLDKPEETKAKPKVRITKPMIIGCVAALMIILGSAVMLKLNNQTAPVNPNAIQNPSVEKTRVVSNGYKFELLNTWYVVENGNDLVINNDSETVNVKLFYLKKSYDTLSANQIEEYFETSSSYSDVNVESITLASEKKAVRVSAEYTNENEETQLIEYYYINGNENLTFGLTSIYKDEQSKKDNQKAIEELAGSISYSDDSIKALSLLSKNAYAYSAGEKIFNNYYYGIVAPEEYQNDYDKSIDSKEEEENTDSEDSNSYQQDSSSDEDDYIVQ